MQAANIPGDVVEFGCNEGKTAAFMAKLTTKRIWVYDSFRGIPRHGDGEKVAEVFKEGLMAVDTSTVLHHFNAAGEPPPTICAKFFKDILPEEIPPQIAFAHLDGDLYDSIMQSLRLVWPRMSRGGVIIVHDYNWPPLPGVKPAVDDFLQRRSERAEITLPAKGSGVWQGIITKL